MSKKKVIEHTPEVERAVRDSGLSANKDARRREKKAGWLNRLQVGEAKRKRGRQHAVRRKRSYAAQRSWEQFGQVLAQWMTGRQASKALAIVRGLRERKAAEMRKCEWYLRLVMQLADQRAKDAQEAEQIRANRRREVAHMKGEYEKTIVGLKQELKDVTAELERGNTATIDLVGLSRAREGGSMQGAHDATRREQVKKLQVQLDEAKRELRQWKQLVQQRKDVSVRDQVRHSKAETQMLVAENRKLQAEVDRLKAEEEEKLRARLQLAKVQEDKIWELQQSIAATGKGKSQSLTKEAQVQVRLEEQQRESTSYKVEREALQVKVAQLQQELVVSRAAKQQVQAVEFGWQGFGDVVQRREEVEQSSKEWTLLVEELKGQVAQQWEEQGKKRQGTGARLGNWSNSQEKRLLEMAEAKAAEMWVNRRRGTSMGEVATNVTIRDGASGDICRHQVAQGAGAAEPVDRGADKQGGQVGLQARGTVLERLPGVGLSVEEGHAQQDLVASIDPNRSGAVVWVNSTQVGGGDAEERIGDSVKVIREQKADEVIKQQDMKVPAWAVVARNAHQEEQRAAIWALDFVNRVPRFEGSGKTVLAIKGAIQGHAVFTEVALGEGLLRYDYIEPWSRHFVHKARGGTKEGDAGWRRAFLRRELRGLVVRDTGAVVVRGLNKFFNIGQLAEVQSAALVRHRVVEVLVKLDGQMVNGVVVGGTVQYWTRKAAIWNAQDTKWKPTAVGVAASRVAAMANGNYDALVRDVTQMGCTAVFEFVGKQSCIKVQEGVDPRLVLIAVRDHVSGRLWAHDQLNRKGAKYGVEVVRRLWADEELSINEVVHRVQGWQNKEGVVVQLSNGAIVKVKSDWWFRSGFNGVLRQQAKEWQVSEQERLQKQKEKLRTREQRLAVVGLQGMVRAIDIFRMFDKAQRVEMVMDGRRNKLRVVVVCFESAEDRVAAEVVAKEHRLVARMAYSSRTRVAKQRRVEVFLRSQVWHNRVYSEPQGGALRRDAAHC